MTAYQRLEGHILTHTLKEISQIRTERLFMDEKNFNFEEQYKCQNNDLCSTIL